MKKFLPLILLCLPFSTRAGITIGATTFWTPTATGNVESTVDLGGLTPKAVWVCFGKSASDGSASANLGGGMGMTDGTTYFYTYFHSQDANADSNAYYALSWNSTGNIMWLANDAGSQLLSSTITLITNGARFSFTDIEATSYRVHVVYFAGSDLSAKLNRSQNLTNTVNTANTIGNVGFEADIVIFPVQGISGGGGIVGFAHNNRSGTVSQFGAGYRSRNAQATMTTINFMRAYAGGLLNGAYSTDGNTWFDISNFTSSGFDLTTRIAAPGTSKQAFYMALRLGSGPLVSSKVWLSTSPTSTGDNTDTSPGFESQFASFVVTPSSAAPPIFDQSGSSVAALGVNFITSGAQYVYSWADQDNVADSNTQSLSDDQSFNTPGGEGTDFLKGTHTAFTSTGITTNWSVVSAVGIGMPALAIGKEAAAGGGAFYRRRVTITQ